MGFREGRETGGVGKDSPNLIYIYGGEKKPLYRVGRTLGTSALFASGITPSIVVLQLFPAAQ